MLEGISTKSKPLGQISRYLELGTVTLANLESPLTTAKVPTPRKLATDLKAHRQYLLKGDPAFASQIHEAGIDGVSCANNHNADYQGAGISEELSALNEAKLGWSGVGMNASAANTVSVKTLSGGYRVGFISLLAFVTPKANWTCTPATQDRPGINCRYGAQTSAESLRMWISNAKENCDFLIVAVHWGVEKRPLPIPYQISLGHAFIDAGADFVWGCHPHVLEPTEIYHGKPILYSAGNLVSPSPGKTGLFKFSFLGSKLQASQFLACSIRNRAVTPARTGFGDYVRLNLLAQKKLRMQTAQFSPW